MNEHQQRVNTQLFEIKMFSLYKSNSYNASSEEGLRFYSVFDLTSEELD